MAVVLTVLVLGVLFAAIFVAEGCMVNSPLPSERGQEREPERRPQPVHLEQVESEEQALVYAWQQLEAEGMFRIDARDSLV